MTVTRDVIEDLIPLYVAGEATAGARRLVEEYAAAHPELLDTLRRAELPVAMGEPSRDLGLRALEQTRKTIKHRNAWLGWAVGASFAVFSFGFHDNRLVFLLFRDEPAEAVAWLVWSLFCYIKLYLASRRLVVTGLGAPHSVWLWGSLATLAAIPFTMVASFIIGWQYDYVFVVPAVVAGVAMARSLNRPGGK